MTVTLKKNSVAFLAARISYIRFFTAVQIYEFHISKIIIHHLDGLFGPNILTRALHRYRRGHGFKSRTGLNFFQVLFSTTRFSSVLSCEELFFSLLHFTTVQIYEFHISKIIRTSAITLKSKIHHSATFFLCLADQA